MMIKDNQDDGIFKQLIELESKVAFQEDTVDSLNDVVSKQQQDILQLKQQMKSLVDELKNVLVELDGGSSPVEQKPPHY